MLFPYCRWISHIWAQEHLLLKKDNSIFSKSILWQPVIHSAYYRPEKNSVLKFQDWVEYQSMVAHTKYFHYNDTNDYKSWHIYTWHSTLLIRCFVLYDSPMELQGWDHRGSAFSAGKINAVWLATGCPTKHDNSKTTWKSSLVFEFICDI